MIGFGLVVTHTLVAGREEDFDALVARTVPVIKEREPGTLVYLTHAVQGHPDQRVFYELYRDRAAFEAHEQQNHVMVFQSEREALVTSIEVDFLEALDGIA